MTGDYTRLTFDPLRRYSGVWMQQGRVQLDADWNEGVDILKDRVRKLSLDVLGRVGVPFLVTPNAFAIGVIPGPPLDLSIGAGRIYVDGYMAENFIPPAAYLTQPFLPDPPPLVPPADVLVILDLWEREVTYIEDPRLLDVALGGVDTTTRIQQVWQLRVVPPPPGTTAECGVDLDALFPPSAGRLTTEAIAPPTPDDPCILPPVGGYRGLENRLYRLEVHTAGPLGVARFKWSRDDGSIVSAVNTMAVAGGQTRINVNRLGRDAVLRFHIDDWVTVTDDWRELNGEPGEMAKIVDIDEAVPALVLDRVLPAMNPRPFGATPADLAARHTRVQLWNENPAVNVLDADGLMLTAPGPIDIEDGIRVRFDMDPVGGSFHVGDYWVFAARTADASVEILTKAPPRGIIHHYTQLAAITGLGGVNIVSDCRPQHHDCACCCVITVSPKGDPSGDFNSLAVAVAALPGLPLDPAAPVLICLTKGEHLVPKPIDLDRPFVTIQGCGRETIVRPRSGLISLNAESQYLEDFAIQAESVDPLIGFFAKNQGMTRIWTVNNGLGPIVIAQRAQELKIVDCDIDGTGGLDLSAFELDVLNNHITRGTLAIHGPSLDVRIHDNRIEGSVGHGITLRGETFVDLIDIHRNEIWFAEGNGVGFDGGDFGPIAAGVTIAHNQIMACVGPNAPVGVMPAGGIVLARVAELEVRENRIAENGKGAVFAVCGVYVHRSWGAQIVGNLISDNGAPADDGAPFPGHQAGIYLNEALIGIGATPDPAAPGGALMSLGNVPAARISGNDVDAPRAHALVILGVGPMIVESNRLQCHDIMRENSAAPSVTPLENLLNWVGSAAIVNLGLPSWLYAFLLTSGFSGAATLASLSFTGFSPPSNSFVGGHVQFRGNQVRLDLSQKHAEFALANMFIASLDDVQFVDNQSEGILRFNPGSPGIAGGGGGASFDFLLGDLTAFAITIRQADNGLFTTPYLTAFSIFSSAAVNHCLGNQTTSCILANGGAPKSKRANNAVLFPHPIYCGNAGKGDD